jgi:excisionase family DNA binding protein
VNTPTKAELEKANKMLSREARLEDVVVVARLLADLRVALADVQLHEDIKPREALNTDEAAAVLGISSRAVQLAVKRERLPLSKYWDGKGYLFEREDVEEYKATRGNRPVA